MSFLKKLLIPKSSASSSYPGDMDHKSSKEDGAKKQKLMRLLVLAQNDPEPLIDLSQFDLTKLDSQILTLIKVYNKNRVHLERNRLTSFTVNSNHFTELSVLHLEDNRISTFQIDSARLLPNLKELYLNSNRISLLPRVLFELPQLKLLSVRHNRLTNFPLELLQLPCLTYCDLSFNQISTLPSQLCVSNRPSFSQNGNTRPSAPSLLYSTSLQVLCLEGNPLQTPSHKYLNLECQDVSDFKEIIKALCHFYQVETPHEVCKVVEEQQQCANASQSEVESDLMSEPGEDELFTQYHQKKLAAKQSNIEWERNYQNRQETMQPGEVRVTCKDKLLGDLCSEQNEMFDKINRFIHRKDAEREKLLDGYIAQLQEHSSRLIEKLSLDTTLLTEATNALAIGDNGPVPPSVTPFETDLNQLLEQYENKLQLKRNILLNLIQEGEEEESSLLTESFQRKDNLHSSLFKELEKQEQSLSNAFQSMLSERDVRNQDLTEKIVVIEQELLALTLVERERRTLSADRIQEELSEQRAKLAQLLLTLLDMKRQREKHLKEKVQKELFRLYERTHQGNYSSWLEEYQQLLEQEPFEEQLKRYGIDMRIADVLRDIHHDLADQQRYNNGSLLQGKMSYYLPCFVEMSVDRFYACNATELMRSTIDDYELCQIIADKLSVLRMKQKSQVTENNVEASASCEPNDDEWQGKIARPSAPELLQADHSKRFWHESECVICLSAECNIVFLPCGHICTCQTCIRPNACPLTLCPLCRLEIAFMQTIDSIHSSIE